MGAEPIIEVLVNGEPNRIATGATLLDLIEQLNLTPQRIAIEHNLEIVSRPRWSETPLRDGDKLEIVHFVGGG
ncbi:MAG: sulfur carrier protein ThiS [Acidobacteriota bacterium]